VSARPELRPLTPEDAAELDALVKSDRARLARWMPWAAEQTLETTAAFIRRATDQEQGNDGFQRAVVVDGAIAGTVGFHRVDSDNRSTSIGYWLGQEYEGRGLMTAAVAALIDHAFGVWKLHRVELRIAPDNQPSRALAARLGFQEEGLLRNAERFGDEYRDLLMYGLLADEWRSTRP
jgi:ribosomal-protein-serine acetyltransferase